MNRSFLAFGAKESIGVYVSGHPLQAYENELKLYERPITIIQRARRDDRLTIAAAVAVLEPSARATRPPAASPGPTRRAAGSARLQGRQ